MIRKWIPNGGLTVKSVNIYSSLLCKFLRILRPIWNCVLFSLQRVPCYILAQPSSFLQAQPSSAAEETAEGEPFFPDYCLTFNNVSPQRKKTTHNNIIICVKEEEPIDMVIMINRVYYTRSFLE